MTSLPMKQKNNNNSSKSTALPIFPDEFRKCFFVLESKMSDVELNFIRFQIKQRTSIILKFEDSIFRLGLSFLLFFIRGIRPILTPFGTTVADAIISKLNYQLAKEE